MAPTQTAAAAAPAPAPPSHRQQRQQSQFPLKEALLATGLGTVAGMFYFWKRKQTVPFKTCYGLMWPTLGVGIMLSVTPSPEEMAQRLERSRAVAADDLQKQRQSNAATLAAMRAEFAPKQA